MKGKLILDLVPVEFKLLKMKGKLSILVLVFVTGMFSVNDLKGQAGLKLGFSGGPQSTWLLNKQDMEAALDAFTYKSTYGMAFCPFFGYDLNDYFGFRIQALYSAQGQKWQNINSSGDEVNHTQRLNYLKAPILFNFSTGLSRRKLALNVAVGYQASFLINARYRNDDQSYTPDEALFDNITGYPTQYQRFSWWDHGPVAQIGVNIKLTYNVVANIHIRGDYGLTDAENKNTTYERWTFGVPEEVFFFPPDRSKTSNLTGGLHFGLTYTFSSN